jgi:hypothetical protein
MAQKRFITLENGEKIKLDKNNRISYKDRAKVISGIPGVKKLREDIKKLKPEKIKQ